MAEITELWNRTDDGADFGADLYERDYFLAISAHRNICVVDSAGCAYCLTEVIQGETTTSILNRIGITALTIEEAKWLQRNRWQEVKRFPDDNPMPGRNVKLSFLLDTNRINARQNLPYMNRLERWRDHGVIILQMPEEAYDEARAGNDLKRTEKAEEYNFIRATDVFGGWKEFRDNLAKLLFKNKILTASQEKDILILFCAKMARAILITNDGDSKTQPAGILGHANELATLGIEIMRDVVAVQRVERAIAFRDRAARSLAGDTGQALPPWVGLD